MLIRYLIRIARPARQQQGVAAIEFAIVLTVLMLILLAIIGYGAIFWTQQQLSAAAGEGARAGLQARYSGQANVQATACAAATSLFGSATAVQCNSAAVPVACGWSGAGGVQVGCISVVLTYEMAQWPLLQSFQDLLRFATGGGADTLIPTKLSARATIQITQEPL